MNPFSMRLLPFLCAMIIFSACSPITISEDRLDGSNWRLESIGATSVLGDHTPTIKFSNGSARGSSGCNTFQGDYSIAGQEITFTQLTMTLMACLNPEGVMELEQRYFFALQHVVSFEAEGDRLSLTTDEGTMLAFIRISE